MIGDKLKLGEGVTHGIFKEGGEGEDGEEGDAEAEEGQEEKSVHEDLPKHLFVKEVVREPKIKFFKVPK
jgi:hypothetical protein